MLEQMSAINCFVNVDQFVWVALFVTANLSLDHYLQLTAEDKDDKNWRKVE